MADLNAWEALAATALPDCQSLHFLQMACEKLAKARLCMTGADPKTLQSSHAYVAKQLPTIVLDELASEKAKPKVRRDIVKHARRLAREIELLAPAVDAGGKRPDNCEYPWEDATGRVGPGGIRLHRQSAARRAAWGHGHQADPPRHRAPGCVVFGRFTPSSAIAPGPGPRSPTAAG